MQFWAMSSYTLCVKQKKIFVLVHNLGASATWLTENAAPTAIREHALVFLGCGKISKAIGRPFSLSISLHRTSSLSSLSSPSLARDWRSVRGISRWRSLHRGHRRHRRLIGFILHMRRKEALLDSSTGRQGGWFPDVIP